jgi:hypothetical protein
VYCGGRAEATAGEMRVGGKEGGWVWEVGLAGGGAGDEGLAVEAVHMVVYCNLMELSVA